MYHDATQPLHFWWSIGPSKKSFGQWFLRTIPKGQNQALGLTIPAYLPPKPSYLCAPQIPQYNWDHSVISNQYLMWNRWHSHQRSAPRRRNLCPVITMIWGRYEVIILSYVVTDWDNDYEEIDRRKLPNLSQNRKMKKEIAETWTTNLVQYN
jgi:hypothetical protein